MSLRTKILLPLLGAFLAAIAATGFIAVQAGAGTVEDSYRRELVAARGFLTRMRPPLGEESLRRMKELWKADLAVAEGKSAVHSTTLPPAEAGDFEAALRSGSLDGLLAAREPGEAERLSPLRLGGRDFRVAAGKVEGPPGPRGEALSIFLLLPEEQVASAKRAAVRDAAAAAAGGILLVALAGWLVARSLSRRLQDLSGAASRIASGGEGGRVREEGGDELARFAGAFNRMVDALAESRDRLVHAERMAALGKLASSVAHEIRNPLASIRMTADLLRADLPGGEPREALDVILREIRRLEQFAEEILSLSGRLAVKPVPCDPAEVAAETVALLKDRLAHLGVAVKNEVEPGPAHPMDRDRVAQVLVNLLLNAAQAAGAGSEVRIGAARPGDGTLRIEVRDPGPGAAPEHEARLFEPFFTTREGGTGLGLAVCRRIAEAHGGRMRYRREGGWTVFSLCLPAPDSSDGAARQPGDPDPARGG